MNGISLSEIENTILRANKEYFKEVKAMCDDNLKSSMNEHLLDKTHFDKQNASVIYQMINSFKEKSMAKYVVGVPLLLLVIERILNTVGLIGK